MEEDSSQGDKTGKRTLRILTFPDYLVLLFNTEVRLHKDIEVK
jgi:hypothetical protein